MKKNILVRVWGVIMVVGLAAGAYYWLQTPNDAVVSQPEKAKPVAQEPAPEYPVEASADASGTSATSVAADGDKQPAGMPGEKASAAGLDGSDQNIGHQLSELIGQDRVEGLLEVKDIIRNFVMTVENATGNKLPSQYSPFKPLDETFRVEQTPEGPILSPANYARYNAYVELLKSVDLKRFTSLYAHYYPLFQVAFREAGGKGYFNDRLVKVLGQILETPDVKGPIKLLPNGYNGYADPTLESKSASQKVLLRMGPENEAVVKRRLGELRELLMHLKK